MAKKTKPDVYTVNPLPLKNIPTPRGGTQKRETSEYGNQKKKR
jgi:hypothetical protein